MSGRTEKMEKKKNYKSSRKAHVERVQRHFERIQAGRLIKDFELWSFDRACRGCDSIWERHKDVPKEGITN